jgi:hypothetical protein
MTVELYGYKYSVYAWIARLALHEKGCAYKWPRAVVGGDVGAIDLQRDDAGFAAGVNRRHQCHA